MKTQKIMKTQKTGIVGTWLDLETGKYQPIMYKDILNPVLPVGAAPKIKKGDKKISAPKIAKEKAVKAPKVPKVKVVKEKVARIDIAESKSVKKDRHIEITKVLASFNGKSFKRNEYMAAAVVVLGKEIPFNKVVREVYCKKVSGAYVSVSVT